MATRATGTRRRVRATIPHARRLGLRARLITAFALGGLALSALMALISFSLVRQNLVEQHERTATAEAYVNARVVRDTLRGDSTDVAGALDAVQAQPGSTPVLYRDGEWYAATGATIPILLRDEVLAGQPASLRYTSGDDTLLVVGLPLPAVGAAYFEISSFAELEGTLRSLALSLVVAGLVTTVAGAALGAYASRHVLRPLAEVRQAAAAIAGGRLDTRVARVDDADLGALVGSFNDMASALQERIESDNRFASDVSHELRSPLTTLAAAVEVLEGQRDELPERARAALDLLRDDIGRFTAMVDGLLEISRFDAGAAHLALDEVDIAELVRQSVTANSDEPVPVILGPGASGCIVDVDKRRFVQVMANLLDNARKYAGGATRVTVEVNGVMVRIGVEDSGPGISPDERERVFERFSRAHREARSRGMSDGVGLGLSLVRGHVELHGGRVWVEDRPDGEPGARFVIELASVLRGLPDEPEPDLGPAAVPASEVES